MPGRNLSGKEEARIWRKFLRSFCDAEVNHDDSEGQFVRPRTRSQYRKLQEEQEPSDNDATEQSDDEHTDPPTVKDTVSSATASLGGNTPFVRWDHIKPFPKGIASSKMWEAWTNFIENFELAASLNKAVDPVRRTQLLLLSMGDELQTIVRAAKLRPADDEPDCYKKFVNNIDEYLKSMTDPSAEHEAFINMRQTKGESIVAYHARLQEKVRLCNYSPTDQDRWVRTQLLNGMANRKVAEAARTYKHKTHDVVAAATRDEAYQPDTTAVQVPEPTSSTINRVENRQVDNRRRDNRRVGSQRVGNQRFGNQRFGNRSVDNRRVDYRGGNRSDNRRFSGQRKRRYENNWGNNQPVNGDPKLRRTVRCSRCDRTHTDKPCPALYEECDNCGEVGHFMATCRKEANYLQNQQDAQKLKQDNNQQINALSLADVLIDCRVGHYTRIQFMVDSGADINVLGGSDWDILQQHHCAGKAKLELIPWEKDQGPRAYASSSPMKIECAFTTEVEAVKFDKPAVVAQFLVIKEGRRSLLGRNTASEMGLLKVGGDINSFEGLAPREKFPKMPGVKVKFSVDQSIPPEKNAYYNVPAAYREGARLRLREMEERGIIERVFTAPTWISGMSAVAKGRDDFRLVVNMRAPNKAIKREYYRLPLLEEMKTKLCGAKFFTKLDLSNAYYHLELATESRELTTFLAEDGMYRFCRLMFGVNAAPEIFQCNMERILESVRNKIVYIDDVLVFARSVEELRKTVARVLQIFRENNLSLNAAKCEFDRTQVKFLGHNLDETGFQIDDSKISSIRKFRRPATTSELRSFLGLASFVSPYIENFADISAPLWETLKDKTWSWSQKQDASFELIKDRIVNCTTTLGYFSDQDKTILYSDASPNALGAVLVQESGEGASRIISFASKALTPTEKKYPQTQREALGAVWAVEHFSYYLLGRYFTLRTDAQGITFILDRSREDSKRALTRADGWALRLSPYRYIPEFVRGNENIADPSSRLYCEDIGGDEAFNEECSPWEVANVSATQPQFISEQEIREATGNDELLSKVIVALDSGEWPKELRSYELVASELHDRNGIIVKQGCVVIPQVLQKKALEVAHVGHPLEAKFKSILRSRVWWPGMSRDAENWVKTCAACAIDGLPERPTPMQRTFAPEAVWDTLAMDFNGPYNRFGGVLILVIIDYRSRYAVARAVKSTNFQCTKAVLNDVFAWEGFPKAIKTDNGPPFNGAEYKAYCEERGIQTIFSTPFFPQQNGLAESFMKNVNKAMSIASERGTNYLDELQASVNAYNASAHSVTKLPPEEVMLGRKIRRGLPLIDFGAADFDSDQLSERDRAVKLQGKDREDARRGAKQSNVKPGDIVIVERSSRSKGDSRFGKARYTVSQEENGNLVLCGDDGQTIKRHISQVKRVHEWREQDDPEETLINQPVSEEILGTSANRAPVNERGDYVARKEEESDVSRPMRQKKAPTYLKDYVQRIEYDPV